MSAWGRGLLTPEGIPEALRAVPHWVVWRAEGDDHRKAPYRAQDPTRRASSTDSATWVDYPTALAAWREDESLSGLGFVVAGDGIGGADLDHVIVDGEVSAPASAILARIGHTYAEISPSGTGVRAFCFAEPLPSGIGKRRLNGVDVELYTQGRFLTVTGRRLNGAAVLDCRTGFATLAAELRGGSRNEPPTSSARGADDPAAWRARILSGESYHDPLVRLAAHYIAKGSAAELVEDALRGLLRESRGERDERWRGRLGEVPRIVASAAEKFGQKAADSDELIAISAESWRDKPIVPRKWVWNGWLPLGHVAGLYGPPGVAKSTLAQHIATAVAAGLRLYGEEVTQGPVLYLSCEDDLEELQRRELAIVNAFGCDWPGELFFQSRLGMDSQLVHFDADGAHPAPFLMRLREWVADVHPIFIILDVVADFWNGNEIVRGQVNEFVKRWLAGIARDFTLCLLFLAHPSLTGMASGTGTSGSTAWEGSVRSRLYLARPMGEDGKFDMESDERILALPKANYAKAGGEIRLRYQEGYLAPVQLAGARAAAEQAERCQAAFLELLAWRTDAGLYLSPSKHSEHYAPAVCARYQKVQGRRYDFTRRDYEQALAEMFADGRLRVERNRRAERDEVVAVGRNLPKVRAEREKVVPTGPEFAGSPP